MRIVHTTGYHLVHVPSVGTVMDLTVATVITVVVGEWYAAWADLAAGCHFSAECRSLVVAELWEMSFIETSLCIFRSMI